MSIKWILNGKKKKKLKSFNISTLPTREKPGRKYDMRICYDPNVESLNFDEACEKQTMR
jgi:hypothetical protein